MGNGASWWYLVLGVLMVLMALQTWEIFEIIPSIKTLVARDDAKHIIVACIPAATEIDLKALARVAKVKRCELVAVKELLGLTGYIRGGCSPLAMKKNYPTFIDSSVKEHDKVYVSAGLRGVQLCLSPDVLIQASHATCEALIKD